MSSPRWGKPLSRAEAEALSRRWQEGDVISEPERWERLQRWIRAQAEEIIAKTGYQTLREVRAYMSEHGLTTMETDADQTLVAQTICEELCAREIAAKHLKGPDLDSAYWSCMHQCAPVTYPETLDPTDPLYPHSPTFEEDFTTTFSLPPRKEP
jgi:hypothetical protein